MHILKILIVVTSELWEFYFFINFCIVYIILQLACIMFTILKSDFHLKIFDNEYIYNL